MKNIKYKIIQKRKNKRKKNVHIYTNNYPFSHNVVKNI